MPHLATKTYDKGEGISGEDTEEEGFSTPLPTPHEPEDALFLRDQFTTKTKTSRMTNCRCLDVEFVADRWEVILPRTDDNLPTHIKGRAEWVPFSEPNKSCYATRDPETSKKYPVEFINDEWHFMVWGSMGWRMQASQRLSQKQKERLGLGGYITSDPEHPDLKPLDLLDEPINPITKGKGKATRSSSTDLHSPRDPLPLFNDDEDDELEEPPAERSPDEPIPRVPTPMPGQWLGPDLEERTMAAQIGEVVKVNPGDFGEPEPEYGQLPQNVMAAAREIFRENPPGTTPQISSAALRSTIGVNPSFRPWGASAATAARIATTTMSVVNPVYTAAPRWTGIARAVSGGGGGGGRPTPGGSRGGGGSGGGSGGGGGGSGGGGPPAAAGATLHGHGGPNGGLKCYDFSSISLLYAYYRLPSLYPIHVPRFVSHITFLSTVILLFIITCRCGPSSSLSQTLTHYAYLLISGTLYDTLTRCGRPFPGLSCI